MNATIKAHRIHVGGDFLKKTSGGRLTLDRPYLAALLWSYRAARRLGARPAGFGYSHVWRDLAPHLKYLRAVGIEIYASVHTAGEEHDARQLGFRIAFVSSFSKSTIPNRVKTYHGDALVCPEQTGKLETCGDCGYCWSKNGGDVAFLQF